MFVLGEGKQTYTWLFCIVLKSCAIGRTVFKRSVNRVFTVPIWNQEIPLFLKCWKVPAADDSRMFAFGLPVVVQSVATLSVYASLVGHQLYQD